LLLLLPALAAADPAQDAAAHHAAALTARAAARADAARAAELAEQQVQAAIALRRLETATGMDADELASVAADSAAAQARLAAAKTALAALIPAMLRLAADPAATLLAAPGPPARTVTGLAVMQGLAQKIAAQAADVSAQAARSAALSQRARLAAAALETAVATQMAAERSLDAQIDAAKTAEMKEADTAARETAAYLTARKKLDSINAAVTALVPESTGVLPATVSLAGGASPVAGRIIKRFGDPDLAGTAQGISFATAPGGRVSSPCAGTVMFAGPFQNYGTVVIADCGGGTSVVLAGMDRLNVTAGQRLARGQPVGAMLRFDATAPTREPVLYVEVRQNDKPVDPATFLGHSG
jgi:septal ring factor EnvC (AmiA/AmiB activator)